MIALVDGLSVSCAFRLTTLFLFSSVVERREGLIGGGGALPGCLCGRFSDVFIKKNDKNIAKFLRMFTSGFQCVQDRTFLLLLP